jgi:hypothetical protein
MAQGDYLVYERASRDEERLFLEVTKAAVQEVGEPAKKRHNRRGRPATYLFRAMILILLLMTYHRKEYREMESHLKNNPRLVRELGLKKAPGKSTIQRAAASVGVNYLVRLNDAITAKFKKGMVDR